MSMSERLPRESQESRCPQEEGRAKEDLRSAGRQGSSTTAGLLTFPNIEGGKDNTTAKLEERVLSLDTGNLLTQNQEKKT